MASSIAGLVTVEEYLRTGYKPQCHLVFEQDRGPTKT